MENKLKVQKVQINDYEILQTLGTGSFGRVRLSKNKLTGEFCALKMLKKAQILRLKQVDHIISENTILSSIDHPFLIQMLGFTQDERYLYFLLEYVQGGQLFSYMRSQQRLDNQEAMIYAAQVTSMFEYLHMKHIVYRDLKPQNILMASDGYLKLTDFGFAQICENQTYTLCGTPQYLAPEILLNQGHGKQVDWWCLGILIYEMLAGIDPFNDEDPMAIYQKILKGKVKFPRDFDPDAQSIVQHLLVADVTKRFGGLAGGLNNRNFFVIEYMFKGVSDIQNHRWFSDIDWDALLQQKLTAPFKPPSKNQGDTSNYSTYPDSYEPPKSVKPLEDPFLNW